MQHLKISIHNHFFAVADLETIKVCVEDVTTLDVSDQSHCKLLIGLILDVHHSADIYRITIHS